MPLINEPSLQELQEARQRLMESIQLAEKNGATAQDTQVVKGALKHIDELIDAQST
jgi:hypothetical protein